MLVLSRRLNEEIIIAGNIRVKVLEISGNRVRIGISAPDQVPVLREEIYSRKNEQRVPVPASELELVLAAD